MGPTHIQVSDVAENAEKEKDKSPKEEEGWKNWERKSWRLKVKNWIWFIHRFLFYGYKNKKMNVCSFSKDKTKQTQT